MKILLVTGYSCVLVRLQLNNIQCQANHLQIQGMWSKLMYLIALLHLGIDSLTCCLDNMTSMHNITAFD
jgi:hypothetical protein